MVPMPLVERGAAFRVRTVHRATRSMVPMGPMAELYFGAPIRIAVGAPAGECDERSAIALELLRLRSPTDIEYCAGPHCC